MAARSAPEATLLERFDGAIPGPRVVAWAAAIAGLALVFGTGVWLLDRRRR